MSKVLQMLSPMGVQPRPLAGNRRPGLCADWQGPLLRVARGRALYRAGDTVLDALYVVRYGAFKICRADCQGRRHIAAFQLPSDLLALDAIGLERHRNDAVALTDSAVAVLGPGDLAGRGACIWPLLAAAGACAQNWAQVMRSGNTEQRLAVSLLNCVSRYAALGYSARSFYLPMTRRDLADYLGMTAESLSRALGRLRTRGLVEVNGTLVTLLDVGRLWLLAGDDKAAREFAAGGLPPALDQPLRAS